MGIPLNLDIAGVKYNGTDIALAGGGGSTDAFIVLSTRHGSTVSSNPSLTWVEHQVTNSPSLYIATVPQGAFGTVSITAMYNNVNRTASCTVTEPIVYNVSILGRLPVMFQEVQYLRTSNTAYPMYPDGVKRIDYDVKLNTTPQDGSALPCVIALNWTTIAGVFKNSGSWSTEFNASPDWSDFSASSSYSMSGLTSRHTYRLDIASTRRSVTSYIDGSNSKQSGSTTASATPNAVFIGVGYSFDFYSCTVQDFNSRQIGNIVPCYRTTDSTTGIYDIVTDSFYVVSGTVGADVT